MTANVTHVYTVGNKSTQYKVTAYANNGSFGNSTGTAAVAKATHSGARAVRANSNHTWSISGSKYSIDMKIKY